MTHKPLFPSLQQITEMEQSNYSQVDEDSHYFENWEQLAEYLKGTINFQWLRKAVDNTIEREKKRPSFQQRLEEMAKKREGK